MFDAALALDTVNENALTLISLPEAGATPNSIYGEIGVVDPTLLYNEPHPLVAFPECPVPLRPDGVKLVAPV